MDKSTRPYQDDLPPPPRLWKHAIRHPFAKNWLTTANIETKSLMISTKGSLNSSIWWIFQTNYDYFSFLFISIYLFNYLFMSGGSDELNTYSAASPALRWGWGDMSDFAGGGEVWHYYSDRFLLFFLGFKTFFKIFF